MADSKYGYSHGQLTVRENIVCRCYNPSLWNCTAF